MNNVRRNTVWVVGEFAAGIFLQFFVMRYIVVSLGLSALGVWAVLISAVQLAKLFDPGAAAGSGRFLSLALERGDRTALERTVASVFYAVVPLYAVLSIVLYYPIYLGLDLVLPADQLAVGRGLLPVAIASYVLQVLAGAYSSSLTSIHAGSAKSQIAITGSLLQAVASVILIPRYGILGLGIAQVVNYLFATVVSVVCLKQRIGIRFRHMLAWHGPTFRSVMHFGIGLQLGLLTWSLFEMSIRFVMAHFGGVVAVGNYEIAYRVASQFRVLAFLIGQPLTSALTALSVRRRAECIDFYRVIYARYTLYALAACLCLIVSAPVIGFVMIGDASSEYLVFSLFVAVGTFAHIVAVPSEQAAVALGLLRYNLLGTSAALVSMIGCGVLFGWLFGASGVASAVCISSIVAAILPIVFNGVALKLPILPSLGRDLRLETIYASVMRRSIMAIGRFAR